MAKKYLSVFNDGTQDLTIKDADARTSKADKVSGSGINNHLAALNSNGNLKDSGKAVEDFATAAQGTKAEETYDAIGIDTEYEYIDLGLPSGTLWAKCNVGAATETEYGNYYMYGKGTIQYNSSDSAYTGTENPLDASVDTATQVMGAAWHTPTQAQFQELLSNTTVAKVTNYQSSGKNGYTFTANNNTLFLPIAGFWFDGSKTTDKGAYWSSTPYSDSRVYDLILGGVSAEVNNGARNCGFSVRGVTTLETYNSTLRKLKDYLPLSAGEKHSLTGELFSEKAIRIKRGTRTFSIDPVMGGNLSDTNVDMGWDYQNREGSGCAFRANDESLSTNAGSFHFWARDDEDTSTLIGYANGDLKWNNKQIATEDDIAEVDRRYRVTVSGNKVTFSESPVIVSGHKVTFN